MPRVPMVLLIALALAAPAFTQPPPGGFIPPPPPQVPEPMRLEMPLLMLRAGDQLPPAMMAATDGLFLVHNGVLAKYDPQTSRLLGTLELFGPAPAWPPEPVQLDDAGIAFLLERARRLAMPALAIADRDLLIVIGSQFFRVDARTLQVKAASTILRPDPLLELARMLEQLGGAGFVNNPTTAFAAAQVQVTGRTLQVVRGNAHLVTVNIEDGAVLAAQALPELLTRRLVPIPQAGPFAVAPLPQGPVEGNRFAVIGTVGVAADTGALFVRDDQGVEYELMGEPIRALARHPRLDTARLLLVGTFHAPGAGTIGKGTLELGAATELGTARPQ